MGFPYPVEYNDPNATYSFVYSVYLSIQNPLDAVNIPQNVIDALSKASNRIRGKSQGYIQQWAKKDYDPRAWMRMLLDDVESGSSFAWTVIPDWVTKILQSFGYDGIKDRGGKSHDVSHTVWIPFNETQVKSAISNMNFNPEKKGIHESLLQKKQ